MSSMTDQAARLYPNSPTMQAAWVAAVAYLRAGRGWVHDLVPAAALRATTRAARLRPDGVAPPLAHKVTPIVKRRAS